MAGGKQYSKLEASVLPENLDPSSNSEEFYYRSPTERRPGTFRHNALYTVLIISNIIFLSLWLRDSQLNSHSHSDQNCVRPKLTFSGPAVAGATQYERRRLIRTLKNNPFTGAPRPELDAAWGKLLEPMSIWITPEEYELANLGAETLALKDGSGYVGEMAVYHELHCIKRIRRHLHLDHYYPNLTADELQFEGIHIDHCLEYWREAAMCRGDPTLTTMFWRDALPTSRAYSDHECVNWDALDSWARSRMLRMEDPQILNQTHRYDWISTPDARTVWREHPDVEVVHP